MLALYDKIASLYNYLLGYKIMTDVNYTAEMVATIEAAQPLDLAKAKHSVRNLIAAIALS